MADLSDVLNVICSNLNTVVYPNGKTNPSIVGVTVNIGPGWPIRNKLDDTLRTGNAQISVFPEDKETVGPVFERIEQGYVQFPQTVFATVSGDEITITGTITTPQAVVTIVNNVPYGYQIQSDDTLDTIATNIAALLPNAVASGNVITVSDFYSLLTRVSPAYSSSVDLGRQKRSVMISCWSQTPQIRTTLGAAIIVYFKNNYRILMPDNYWANVFYQHTREIDALEKQDAYRRDVMIQVLYATTYQSNQMTFVWPVENAQESSEHER